MAARTEIVVDGNGEDDTLEEQLAAALPNRSLSDVAAGTDGFKVIGEAEGDAAGESVGDIGDQDGNGRDEAVIGAPDDDTGGRDAGAAYVVFGKNTGTPVDLSAVAGGTGGYKIIGETAGDSAGNEVSSIFDLNGDGRSEVLISALFNAAAGEDAGAAYVVFGKASGAPVNLDDVARGTGGYKIIGEAAGDFAGAGLSPLRDVNGDGLDEVLVGASGNDEIGAAYVVFGKATGTPIDLSAVAAGTGGFKILGEEEGGDTGSAVSQGFDLNGDGTQDILIGAPFNNAGGSSAGAAYVVFGRTDGNTVDLDDVADGTGGFKIIGERDDLAGSSIAPIGDLNGDGRAEVLVSAQSNDAGGTDAGAAYVVFGKADGESVQLADVAAGRGGFKIIGEERNDLAGIDLIAISDLNGDGLDEIVVGVPFHDPSGNDEAGAAYVVFGKADTTPVRLDDVADGRGGFKISGEAAGDEAGSAVSVFGEQTGNALNELLIGAPGVNDSAGADYALFF